MPQRYTEAFEVTSQSCAWMSIYRARNKMWFVCVQGLDPQALCVAMDVHWRAGDSPKQSRYRSISGQRDLWGASLRLMLHRLGCVFLSVILTVALGMVILGILLLSTR